MDGKPPREWYSFNAIAALKLLGWIVFAAVAFSVWDWLVFTWFMR